MKSKRPARGRRMIDPKGGFSLRELVEKLSNLHGIQPTKTFKNKIEVALRRGIQYGILVKYRNKYRFDPETSLLQTLNRRSEIYKKVSARRAASGKRGQLAKVEGDKTEGGGESPRVPRPTVPPPPTFVTKPRNLNTEPLTKIIKSTSRKKK